MGQRNSKHWEVEVCEETLWGVVTLREVVCEETLWEVVIQRGGL